MQLQGIFGNWFHLHVIVSLVLVVRLTEEHGLYPCVMFLPMIYLKMCIIELFFVLEHIVFGMDWYVVMKRAIVSMPKVQLHIFRKLV